MSSDPPKPKRAPKVHWSDEEKAVMLATARALQVKDGRLGGLALFRRAMHALAPTRHRRIVALTLIPWFTEGLRPKEADDPVKLGTTLGGLPADHAMVPLLEAILIELRALTQANAELVDLVRSAGLTLPKPSASSELSRSLTRAREAQNATPPRPQGIRIAIVGADDDQAGHVAKQVGDRARLAFLDRGRVGRKLPSADWIILTRHVGHDWYERAKQVYGQGRVVRLPTSGVESLVKKVYDLASRQEGKA